MTNPEELEREFVGTPARVWVARVVLALAVGAGIAVGLGPAARQITRWRAHRLVAEARQAYAAAGVAAALEPARAALALTPDQGPVLRLNAELLAEAGDDACLDLWRRLAEAGEATVLDRAAYAEAAVAFDRIDLSGSLLSNLTQAADHPARVSRAAALHALAESRPEEALRHARDAWRIEPGDATNALVLGRLLATAPNAPERRAEARRLFWQVAQGAGPTRLEALRRLALSGVGERSDREQVAAGLAGLSRRTVEEDDLLAEIRMSLEPDRAAEIAAGLIAGMRRNDADHLTRVVGILVRQGRYEEVLRLTSGDRSLQNRDLFLARHDALLGTAQTEKAYRHLLVPRAPLAPFTLELARVRAAQNAGSPERRDAHLRDLLRAAGDHPRRLREAAETAASAGARTIAVEAWTRLAEMPEYRGAALRSLQRLADDAGDTWKARDFARRAAGEGDADGALELDLAYYDLLLGENTQRALRDAQQALARQPDDLFRRAVVALGHLRTGAPAEALQVLGGVEAPTNPAPQGVLATLVAALGANGHTRQASALAARIPQARLRPEERSLVRPWLASGAAVGEKMGP